ILAMQHGALERAFTDVVIQRRTGIAQECRQSFPMSQAVRDGFAQARVGLHQMLGELRLHPFLQAGHERLAVLLMKQQAVLPGKYSAIWRPSWVDTMPLVNVPVRSSDASRTIDSTRIPVSSLCSTSPCAACRISSSRAALMTSAVSSTISHCVEAGNGIPSKC